MARESVAEPGPRAASPAGVSKTGDVRAVATLVRSLVMAWNRGDADGFGAAFARSATYATGAGRLVRGRAAITALVGRAGGNVRIVGPIEVRCRGAAASARFRWSATRPHGSARRGTIACSLTREGTTWLVRRLGNDERRG